ncbi:MAG: PAS domain S-box protein [Flavobacterium sp.]|nr:PAS domain S-box protein [Flavobacterium sp.]
MKDKAPTTSKAVLLQKAEDILKNKTLMVDTLSMESETLKLIHEIDLHQIELEMQNEELKIAKKQLETAVEKYTDLYDFAPSGYFSLSKNGVILELNFRGANMLGKERSLLINKPFSLFVSEETKSTFNSFLDKAFEEKTRQTCEIKLSVTTEPPTYLLLNGNALGDEEQCIITAVDISKRKKGEEDLEINTKKYQTIFDSNRDSITIFRINPDGNPGNFIDANQATTDIFGYTKQDLMSLSVRDLESVSPEARKTRVETLLSEGSIDFETSIKTKNGDTKIAEVKSLIINYLKKPAIMNITRDITERKQIENNSKKAHENLTTILDAIPDLMFEVGLDGRIYHYHSDRTDLLAAPPEAFLNKFFQDLLPADVSNICMNAILEANEKGWSGGQQYSLDLPKGKHWFELSVSPINESNVKDRHFILLARDITKRKLAEKTKNDSLELIKRITSRVPGVVYQFKLNPDGTYCFPYASDGMKQIYDVSPDEVKEDASKIISIIHSDDLDRVLDSIQESAKNLAPWKQEYRAKFKDGEILNLYGTATPQLEEDGSVLWHGFITDITEKKIIEEKLTVNEEFLNQTQIIAKLGSYCLEIVTEKWTSSPVLDTIFGIDTDFDRTIENWEMIVHPQWRAIMHDYVINEVISKRNKFNKEYKIIKVDTQEERWVHGMGELLYNDLGEPIKLIGTIQDITERKQTDGALRESEEKYRSLVENSPDAVVIYTDDKVAFVNDEGIRMIGAKNKKEIIGKPVLQFIHPDSLASIIQRMEEVLRDSNASDIVEEKFIDLNGKAIDVELKAIPTVYEHKNAVQVIIHDITKRKQATLELNKINRVYSLISQINNLILRSKDREELFQEICRIAVIYGKFRMSWIGMLDHDKQTIETAAFYGFEEGYFTRVKEITIQDVPRGKGPTGTAMREGKTIICNDIANDPMMKPWREEAIKRGYRSSISIPIIVFNKINGSFNLYSEETDSFSSEEEVALLEKITQNIAFTLESIVFEEERKLTQEKIQQLSRAVEQSPVSIIITNISGDIEYVNPKFSEISGYSFDEAIGQNPRVLKSGYTSNEEYKQLWQTLEKGNEWHGEFQNVRKDGKLYWESASISPILNSQGQTTHYIAIKEDITGRKNVEQELILAKEKAEESDRLKLAFLANMSHEIRTPMNGILGFTELLKSPKLTNDEQQEYVKIIEKSGIRMLNIINDIISISKVESGQVEIALSETNINEQIEYLFTFFKPEASQKGIQLFIKNPLPAEEASINTDREKVYAILTNLVKNAIKFTDSGSIDFGYAKKGNYLEFYVKDSGMGISNSQQKIIFERFRQANDSISRSHEGSGLGLAISKAYVEMLGGKIWVESKEGKGSCFYFTLPFDTKPEAKTIVIPQKEVEKEKTENEIKDLKILIVEDDPISKLLITIAVKTFSKDILKVSTGLEAIEACRKNPDIDLVMMDINMPEMGGYEATERIREFNKKVVIIAQTANGMQSDRDEAIAAGCTDYVSKPVNIAALSELIHKYFKK